MVDHITCPPCGSYNFSLLGHTLIGSFLEIRMDEKNVKIHLILFKNWKLFFKCMYQTRSDLGCEWQRWNRAKCVSPHFFSFFLYVTPFINYASQIFGYLDLRIQLNWASLIETNIQNSIRWYEKVVLILVPRVLLMILKKILEIDSN